MHHMNVNYWRHLEVSNISNFNYMFEGQQFVLFTDHKPLTFVLKQKLDKASPRQINHLNFISQFTTNIHHVSGDENIMADFLSCIEVDEVALSEGVDFSSVAKFQSNCNKLDEARKRRNNVNVVKYKNTTIQRF